MKGFTIDKIFSSIYNKETREYFLDYEMPKSRLNVSFEAGTKMNATKVQLQFSNKVDLDLNFDESRFFLNVTFGNDAQGRLMATKFNFSPPEIEPKFNYGKSFIQVIEMLSSYLHVEDDDKSEDFVNQVLQEVLNEFLKQFKSVEELTEFVAKTASDETVELLRTHLPCNEV